MEGAAHWRGWIAAPLLAAVVVLAQSGLAEARQSPAVVTINDPAGARAVTEAQLAHWVEIARLSSGVPDTTSSKRFLQAQVMQLLIGEAWIEGEARAQGITVTEQEVEAAFAGQKRQSFPKESDFRRFLRTSGQTRGDVLMRVRSDLLSTALRDRVVAPAAASVTDANVDAYIAENGPMEIPEQRDLRVVLTKTRAQAQRARSALERGTPWKQVVRRYSLDEESAGNGGRLRSQASVWLPKPLGRAVFRARKGRLVGPVKTREGYYVFKVTRVKPASAVPAGKRRRLVRDHLRSEAEEAALTTFVTEFTAT